MAEGNNILELVLNRGITDKFAEVDRQVSSLNKNFEAASQSANNFAQALGNIKTMLNDISLGDFNSKISQFVESIGKLNTLNDSSKMLNDTQQGINNIGAAATSNQKQISDLVTVINSVPEALEKVSKNERASKKNGKTVLDNLLFDTSDLEAKRAEFASELEKFKQEASRLNIKIIDEQKLQNDLKFLESYTSKQLEYIKQRFLTLKSNITNYASTFGGDVHPFDKLKDYTKIIEGEYQNLLKKFEDIRNKLVDSGASKDGFIAQLQTINNRIKNVEKDFENIGKEIDYFAEKNKKIEQSAKQVGEYKARLEELNKEWERMKYAGTAYDKNGKLTNESTALIEEKKIVEEKIKMYQMSADEAIKYSQKAADEELKAEKNKFAEIEKLYAQKLELEKKQAGVDANILAKQARGENFSKEIELSEAYRKKIVGIEKEILNLEIEYPELAAKAREAYDIKLLEAQVALSDKYDALIERAVESTRRLAEAKREAEKNSKLGLFGDDSTQPKTIQEYEIAIRNLKNEIKKLDPKDKESLKLYNDRIKEYTKIVDEAIGKTNRFAQENRKLKDILQQVAGAFGIYIGLQSITNFARNVAQITGEFEMQHRAMQAIIGDMDEANKLWDKTIALAVKSPYRVKDLVTYTKQLAAYRIETSKLYETTKMLADISSGLGVDMGRLILAYGQVKAANYLRGQELRQFSEAGVNILGELSNYFSELQGRAISTGEVFEMVSKRMVKFEDVSTVLHRLTEEGGIFFNMQEIQAETLQGKMMNLKDSFDIMMNSIGEQKRGVIVGFVDAIKSMVDNWKTVKIILESLLGIFAAFKIAQIAGAVNMIKLGESAEVATVGLGKLGVGLVNYISGANAATGATASFSTALKGLKTSGGWIGIVISLLATAGVVLYDMYKKSHELEKELNAIQIDASVSTSRMTNQYIDMASKIRDVNTTEQERIELMNKMKRMYGDILPDRLLNIDYLKKEGNAYTEATAAIKDYYQSIRREKEIQATEEKYGETVTDSQNDLAEVIQKQIERNHDFEVGLDTINAVLEEFKKRIDEGTVSAENMEEVLTELIHTQTGIKLDAFDFGHFVWSKLGKDIMGIDKPLASFIEDYVEYNTELQKLTGRTTEYLGDLKEALKDNVFKLGEEELDKEIDKKIATGEIDDTLKDAMEEKAKRAKTHFLSAFAKFMTTDIFKSYTDEQKRAIGHMFEDMLDDKMVGYKLKNIQKTIAEKLDEFSNKTNLNKEQRGIVAKFMFGSVESNKEYYERVKNDAENMIQEIRDIRNGISEESEEQQKNLLALEPFLKMFLELIEKFWGKTKKTGSGGNPALQRLNKQISTLKEANQQYEKYLKLYEKDKSFEKVSTEFAGRFAEIGLTEYVKGIKDFDGGTIKDAFRTKLKPFVDVAGKEGRYAAESFYTEFQYGIDEKKLNMSLDKFKDAMDNAFNDYDMYKELEKLGIGGDISEAVFGVRTKSMNQLKKALEDYKMANLQEYLGGTETTKVIDDLNKKISEMEDKERVERLKKYTEYLIKGRDEALKIKLEELRHIAEFEESYSDRYTETQRKDILDNIRKETEAALNKNKWEEFKGSDFYTTMFEDVNHVANSSISLMIGRLQELKGKLNELNPTQVKEIVQAIDKLEDEDRRRNPFRYILKDLEKIKKWDRKGNESTLAWLTGTQKEKEEEKDEIINMLAEARAEYEKLSKNEIPGDEIIPMANVILLEKRLRDVNEELEDLKKQVGDVTDKENEGRKAWDNYWESVQKGIDYFKQASSAIGDVSLGIMDMMNGIDDASKQLAQDIVNMAENIGNLASDIAKIIASEGSDFGSWVSAFVNVFKLIKNAAKINENNINFIIEEAEKNLTSLEQTYERVSQARERAWDVQTMIQNHRSLIDTIQREIKAYNAMIEAEQARKNPDEKLINEWRSAVWKLRDQMSEEMSTFLESVGGLGGDAKYYDAASSFVDAWMNAFKETGDGLSGLQERFEEVIENLVKKQALARLSQTIMEPLFRMIDEAAKDGIVTQEELDLINKFAEMQLPEWNNALKAFAESLGLLGNTAKGELDGLQKGIQGVTEQTAEIIASYMNSIRFYIIDTNTKLNQLISFVQNLSIAAFNPMIEELRGIKQRTDDIYNFLYARREVDSIRVTVV